MVKEQPNMLLRLAENEEAIAALYQEYAGRFPEYDSFWRGLAHDEEEHAGWIRVLGSTDAPDEVFVDRTRFNEQAIQTYLDYLRRELAKVQQGETTLLNALAVTLYIEESLIERKYFEVFDTDAPRLKQVLQNLAAATRTHVEKARETLDSYKRMSSSSE
ncbi:MAG: DUF2202 domain-containing protein [Dehalococcoidia bacterium]|nr:DUF2202 domain-containing protein [Dehalococcoidia bacterium]